MPKAYNVFCFQYDFITNIASYSDYLFVSNQEFKPLEIINEIFL